MRFELMTSSLPRKRSTPELHWLFKSGRRGSNPRPTAWKADALPTELLPLIFCFEQDTFCVAAPLSLLTYLSTLRRSFVPRLESALLKAKSMLQWTSSARCLYATRCCLLIGGERRIRTSEGVRQQIYSLPQLATLVSPRIVVIQ